MFKTVLAAAFSLGLAGQGVAQGTAATQNPPSPNAGVSQPESPNSLPPGAATATGNRPGDAIGGTATVPPAGTGTTQSAPR